MRHHDRTTEGAITVDPAPGRVDLPHVARRAGAARRRRASDELKELLTTVAVAGGIGVVSPNAYAVFSRSLPPYTPPRSQEDSRAALVEALTELGEHGVSVGAMLLLEPLNRYEDYLINTLADAVSVVSEVESSGVAVVADTYHNTPGFGEGLSPVRLSGRNSTSAPRPEVHCLPLAACQGSLWWFRRSPWARVFRPRSALWLRRSPWARVLRPRSALVAPAGFLRCGQSKAARCCSSHCCRLVGSSPVSSR